MGLVVLLVGVFYALLRFFLAVGRNVRLGRFRLTNPVVEAHDVHRSDRIGVGFFDDAGVALPVFAEERDDLLLGLEARLDHDWLRRVGKDDFCRVEVEFHIVALSPAQKMHSEPPQCAVDLHHFRRVFHGLEKEKRVSYHGFWELRITFFVFGSIPSLTRTRSPIFIASSGLSTKQNFKNWPGWKMNN